MFTYHLVRLPFLSAIKILLFPVNSKKIKGLIYAETMSGMTLGAPVFSIKRILMRQVVVFAQWESENDANQFLENTKLGRKIARGWYIKLLFLRQWGTISGFDIPKESQVVNLDDECAVSVTIARLKMFQIPRFIRWGRPVEKLVRDHQGSTLSLASIRFPRTVSTFSIWKTQKQMIDMVRGHSNVPKPKRHIEAMKERERKDFHFEFTTLRFKPVAEFGQWNKKSNYIPKK